MNKCRDTLKHSKDKLAQGAVVSGVTAALAAASLVGTPNADATCLGIFGISINDGSGGHCSSSLFSFALGLGPGTTATAGGNLNAAIAVGTNVEAIAGAGTFDSLNLALNFGSATDGATSTVTAGRTAGSLLPSNFNLAANFGGNANFNGGAGFSNMDIFAGDGYLNVAVNVIGNRNTVHAEGGLLNFATNVGVGSPGRGSDSRVTATGNLSAAFNSQTPLGETCTDADNCGNVVTSNGPLSLVVAAGVVGKLVEGGSGTPAAGAQRFITLANSFNSGNFDPQPPPTTVLSASGTQKNRVRASLNAASHRAETTSPGGSVHKSVSDSIKNGAKKSSDPASRDTSGPARKAKADADSTDRD